MQKGLTFIEFLSCFLPRERRVLKFDYNCESLPLYCCFISFVSYVLKLYYEAHKHSGLLCSFVIVIKCFSYS